jgi:hypothetical protein
VVTLVMSSVTKMGAFMPNWQTNCRQRKLWGTMSVIELRPHARCTMEQYSEFNQQLSESVNMQNPRFGWAQVNGR